MLALVLPFETGKLFGEVLFYDAARYLVDTIAVVGVAGYAFNIPTGPKVMWRVFAPIFILFSLIIAASGLPRLFEAQVPSTAGLIVIFLGLCVGAAITGSMSLALLRHGDWLDANRVN